jgi:hypothetical protein
MRQVTKSSRAQPGYSRSGAACSLKKKNPKPPFFPQRRHHYHRPPLPSLSPPQFCIDVSHPKRDPYLFRLLPRAVTASIIATCGGGSTMPNWPRWTASTTAACVRRCPWSTVGLGAPMLCATGSGRRRRPRDSPGYACRPRSSNWPDLCCPDDFVSSTAGSRVVRTASVAGALIVSSTTFSRVVALATGSLREVRPNPRS